MIYKHCSIHSMVPYTYTMTKGHAHIILFEIKSHLTKIRNWVSIIKSWHYESFSNTPTFT